MNCHQKDSGTRPFQARMGWAVLAALLLCGLPARAAVILSWNNLVWAPGTLTNTYYAGTTATGSNYVDAADIGASVTFTLSGNTQFFESNSTFGGPTTFPTVTNDLWGGNASGTNTLQLWIDHFTSNTQKVTLTVTFNGYASVSNLAYTLFDIDRGNGGTSPYAFVDQITKISATGTNGTLIAPTITTNTTSDVVITGAGTNQVLTGLGGSSPDNGAGSGAGDAFLNFGTNDLTSFTFTYGDDQANSSGTPAQQIVGVTEINFNPNKKAVPEFGPALAAAAMCGLAIFLRRRKPIPTAGSAPLPG